MLVVITVLSAFLQEFSDQDRFGKTVEQVLAMGRESWHAYYTDESRGGGSTAGETFAQMIFADCLKVKNELHFKTARDRRTSLVLALDAGFARTVQNCVGAGSALTGGGTMWNTIGAGAEVERQLTIRDLVWPSEQAPVAPQSDAWRAFRAAWKAVTDHKSDIESYSERGEAYYKGALKSLSGVNADLMNAVTSMKSMPSGFKGRVFAFYVSQLKLVRLGVE